MLAVPTVQPEPILVPPSVDACSFRKSYPDVLMMQPGQDGNGDNDPGPLDCTMQRRIFL